MSAMGNHSSKAYGEPRPTTSHEKPESVKKETMGQVKPNPDSKLVPDWINKSHFEEILKDQEPEFEKIENFFVMPALSAGENYSSLMLRVTIETRLTDNTLKDMSFMMKVPHESAKMQQMLKTVNFFTVENATYEQIVTKFEELYRNKGLNINFAPRTYNFKDSLKKEPKLINSVLMYDMAQDGYRNANRLECLNFEESKLVLRKLAQYHAAGAYYRTVNGPYTDIFTQPMFGSDHERSVSILEGIMGPFKKMFLENLKNFKDGEKYYDKFVVLFTNMSETFLKLSSYDPDEFNVINHGDCWVNNFLFKYGTRDELIDLIFVDFQLPKYGHPSTDLLNFIMTSVHIDHKLKDFDFFIKYYYDNLVEHLSLLGYEERVPTLKELHTQLFKYNIWAITASVMVLPIVLLDPNEEIFDSRSSTSQLYNNMRYKTNIEQILPWLDNRGLLEFLT